MPAARGAAGTQPLLRRSFLPLIVLLLAASAAALWLLPRYLNTFKPELVAFLQERTGRAVRIDGDLGLAWSWHPSLTVEGIVVPNAPWGSAPDLLTVGRLELRLDLPSLIRKPMRFDAVRLDDAQLWLERDGDGRPNWLLQTPQPASVGLPPPWLHVVEIDVTRSRVRYLDRRAGRGPTVDLRRLVLSPTADQPQTAIDLSGAWDGNALQAKGTFGALGDLAAGARQRIDLVGQVRDIAVTAKGTLARPLDLDGADLQLTLAGRSLEEFGRIVGVPLPSTERFTAAGRLTGRLDAPAADNLKIAVEAPGVGLDLAGRVAEIDGLQGIDLDTKLTARHVADLAPFLDERLPDLGELEIEGRLQGSTGKLVLSGMRARLGESDLAGDVAVTFGRPPKLEADLTSQLIDLTPLAAAPAEAGTAAGGATALVPDVAIPTAALAQLDAEVKLAAEGLRLRHAEAETAVLDLALASGRLQLDPVRAVYAGAKISGALTLEPVDPPAVTLRFLTQGFDLGRFLQEADVTDLIEGEIDVAADLGATGASTRALAESASGQVGAVMGRGELGTGLVDFLAEDLVQRFLPFSHNDDDVPVKCALALFDVAAEQADSAALILETRRILMTGKGTLDLADERIDFVLSPRPRDASLVSLSAEITLTGSLTHPAYKVNEAELIERGALAVAAGAVALVTGGAAAAVPAVLAPFARLGAKRAHPCSIEDLIADVGVGVGTSSSGEAEAPAPAAAVRWRGESRDWIFTLSVEGDRATGTLEAKHAGTEADSTITAQIHPDGQLIGTTSGGQEADAEVIGYLPYLSVQSKSGRPLGFELTQVK